MDVQIIKGCRYLHHDMHSGKKALDAVDCIVQEMFFCLINEKIIKVFGKLFNQYDFCDVVLKEFTDC